MDNIAFEIIDMMTSPAVLISTVVIVMVLLSGLAAEAQLFLQDLGHRWKVRTRNSRSTGARYRTQMAVEMDPVR
jgi:hypothetical protein